jgi:hypothetical protein
MNIVFISGKRVNGNVKKIKNSKIENVAGLDL